MVAHAKWWLIGAAIAVAGLIARAAQLPDQVAPKPSTPQMLKAEIDGLRPAKVAWREITWKSCLVAGLQESRATNKPVLLWVFIDRPADDARC